MINPFRPTAGAEPPSLIGRDKVVVDFIEGLQGGVGAPGRLMKITGPRGSGKTVLLTELGEKAANLGWKVVNVAAGADLIPDLVYELEPPVSIEGANLAANAMLASADVTVVRKEPNLRALMKSAAAASNGLLVTVDEVQDASTEDMQRIAHSIQLLIREKVNIAFVFAGLPSGVLDVVNGKALTFLRRAVGESLGLINQVEVGISLTDSFAATGLELAGDQVAQMARATKGYAYLIQLVGYYVWQRADAHREKDMAVSSGDVELGVDIAMQRFHEDVHEPALAGLTKGAIEYLLAMCDDERASKTSDVAARMERTTSATSSFRRSLLQRQVIEVPMRGYVAFAIPFLRGYLLDNREELLDRF